MKDLLHHEISFKGAQLALSQALNCGRTVVAVGRCTVKYSGRAASKISEGDRLLIIKSDGTFLVHQSKKMAAINYQGPGARISCAALPGGALSVVAERSRPMREKIEVVFSNLQFVQSFELHDDEAITVLGTERELANLLMDDLHSIERGLVPLKHESSLAKGMIDILAEDRHGNLVVVELKRRTAHLAAASQLQRYVQELSKRKNRRVRGILCSPSISPNAKAFLEKEGMEWHRLDYSITTKAEITGLEKKQKMLDEF